MRVHLEGDEISLRIQRRSDFQSTSFVVLVTTVVNALHKRRLVSKPSKQAWKSSKMGVIAGLDIRPRLTDSERLLNLKGSIWRLR